MGKEVGPTDLIAQGLGAAVRTYFENAREAIDFSRELAERPAVGEDERSSTDPTFLDDGLHDSLVTGFEVTGDDVEYDQATIDLARIGVSTYLHGKPKATAADLRREELQEYLQIGFGGDLRRAKAFAKRPES